jgi:hypothetical protein
MSDAKTRVANALDRFFDNQADRERAAELALDAVLNVDDEAQVEVAARAIEAHDDPMMQSLDYRAAAKDVIAALRA